MPIAPEHLIAAAMKRLSTLEASECMDPVNPDSRPTPAQQRILDNLGAVTHRYVVAGNQCLAENTEIITTSGIRKIQDIQVGDFVYNEYGDPIEVLKTFNNGLKEVVELTNRGQLYAECTTAHQFLTRDTRKKHPVAHSTQVSDFCKYSQVQRVWIDSPLGEVHEPHAYAIGALLGDGCCRTSGKVISSQDEEVVREVATILGCSNITKSSSNYSWRLRGNPHCNYYNEWCKDKYAHEKLVDITVIKQWNRDSLLRYVAGIIDTDGSIYVDSWKNLTIRAEMQAKSVIESLQYAFMALWQIPTTIQKCDRDKYVNGPTWCIKCANNAFSKRAVYELSNYLVCTRKQWKSEYGDLVAQKTNEKWVGLKQGTSRVVNTYDIHVASPSNLYCLANGLVTHNSGKTQLGAREATWIFTETHPKWTRPARWGNEPLLLLIVGRTTKQVEEVIWRKIRSFLPDGEYKEVKQGGVIQKVIHLETGNTILFASHHNENEAREKLQAFVAHYVWIDEMPGSYKLIEELQRRVQSRGGYFLATFTPKVRNDEIRRLVDAAREPHSAKLRLRMFDNPVLTNEDKERILAELSTMPESYRNTVLNGDWSLGEQAVYDFRSVVHVADPREYSKGWRHVLSVDPAMASKLGLTLWAECPATGVWYCILADYVSGLQAPSDMVEAVEGKVRGYNIVRRISDPHEVWYIGAASKMGYTYMGVYRKNDRKKELIKNLQTSLTENRIKVCSWCEDLVDEFISCQYSETVENKIINASKFHLLDSAQYFNDLKPKPDVEFKPMTRDAAILHAHNERKKREHAARTGPKKVRRKRWKLSPGTRSSPFSY